MDGPVIIRREEAADVEAVGVVNRRAFEGGAEAALVDALRGVPGAVSLVAAAGGRVVGHILFTPVDVEGVGPAAKGLGLGPMAVLPEHQRQGIGSQLVRAGLSECRAAGCGFVVVLGHAEYYPRFGFEPAWLRHLQCEFDAPRDSFMVLELRAGALSGAPGLVRYRPEFAQV